MRTWAIAQAPTCKPIQSIGLFGVGAHGLLAITVFLNLLGWLPGGKALGQRFVRSLAYMLLAYKAEWMAAQINMTNNVSYTQNYTQHLLISQALTTMSCATGDWN
ncbi:hypothetical protein ADT30_00180 (plasmid) [Xylella fastidiosa]|nr:hypothetical protein ADT30_00180 [Xylella fastidiosa]